MTGLISGAVALAVYFSTVAPGIAGGDSGELVAESCHLGTAHPPGYPLFTVLNHLAIRILPGLLDSVGLRPGPGIDGRASPAWCSNATASAMGALAVMLIAQTTHLLCNRWSGDNNQRRQDVQDAVIHYCWWEHDGILRGLASGSAAILMAFSPLMWQYSVTAEVFALNNFLLALLCFLAVRFSFHRKLIYAAEGALVCGLALSNQHTAVLFVAPLASWVAIQLVTSRCRSHAPGPWRRLALETLILASLLLFGLMPYIYLPLAAKHAPKPGSWGDVASWRGVLHHVRRGDYGSLRLYSGRVGDEREKFSKRLLEWVLNVSLVQGLAGLVPALAVLGTLSWYMVPRKAILYASGIPADDRDRRMGTRLLAPSFGSQTPNGQPFLEQSTRESKASALGAGPSVGQTGGQKKRSRKAGCVNDKQNQHEELRKPSKTLVEIFASWDDGGHSASTALLMALTVYLMVFHWLSNMPLDDPLLFGIHARFWMQPNMIVFIFCGTGLYRVFHVIRFVITLLSNEPWHFRRVRPKVRGGNVPYFFPKMSSCLTKVHNLVSL